MIRTLKRFYRFCFPKVPVDIPVGQQRAVVVRRLREQLVLGWFGGTGVAGRVTNRIVRLHHVEGLKANSFKPWLFAGFVHTGDQVHISGYFRMHPFAQAFATVWMSGLALMLLYLVLMALFGGVDEPFPFNILIFGVGIFAGGVFLLEWAWRWSEHDMDVIENFVREIAVSE